ncbi:MAG: hypothetical protein U0105_25680 [Candidatus Obscuribacterales bacterium]
MNVVFLSPHFPPNFQNFCQRLRAAGATVLGLADAHWDSMTTELQHSLSDYYRVNDMHNYDELVRALGWFTHKYGKIDRIDSQNEYWLETEARLRTDFNVSGIRMDAIDRIKRKSEMKSVFQKAGLRPARGRVCRTESEVRSFMAEVGYPVVAKPDTGVGAATTYKIANDHDVERYLRDRPSGDYIFEEFINSQIVTFDGLTDAHGNLVFSSSLRYSKGVMEAVNEDSDIYYWFVRHIEPQLKDAGLATLKAFDVRERFFHFEYFMDKDGDIVPMEVNMRPPGGLTLDMFNFANDFDCYKIWAEMLVTGKQDPLPSPKYHVMYVGRKDHICYSLPRDEIFERYGKLLIHHERIRDVFSLALGNDGFILRNAELEPLIEAAEAIQKRA